MKHSLQRVLPQKEERSLNVQGKVLPTSEHQEERLAVGLSQELPFQCAPWLYLGHPPGKEGSRWLHLGGDAAGGGRQEEEGQQRGPQPSKRPGGHGKRWQPWGMLRLACPQPGNVPTIYGMTRGGYIRRP